MTRTQTRRSKIEEFIRGLIKSTTESSIWPGRTSIFWTISLTIEPLVFYVPLINYQGRSLRFNHKPQFIILLVFYLISCCVINVYYFSQMYKRKLPFGWINTFAVTLLIPIYFGGLMLTLYLHTPKFLFTSVLPTLIAVLLVLYLWRVLVIYRHFIHTALRKSAGFRIGINFVLFLYGGHLFGGLWYFFAVFQTMHCWSRACSSFGGCSYRSNRFIVRSEDSSSFDEICSNTSENTFFDFGIFKDAIKSHIVEAPYLGTKLLYCFRWGIQNISGFGQNLQVSSMNARLEVSMNALDNIFVILIAIYGIVTFTFFIGNMQDLVVSSTTKFKQEKTERWSRRDLLNWYPFKQLSLEKQNSIVKSCRQRNWPQSGLVNLPNLLNNLPADVQINIKRIFCSDLLRKIPICETWTDEWINEVCDYAKPVIYGPDDIIMENGKPIDEMLIVVEGKVVIKSGLMRPTIRHVKGHGHCGEELIGWFEDDPNSEELPFSSKTIKVVEQLHAFAIVPEDIQIAIKGHQPSAPSQ